MQSDFTVLRSHPAEACRDHKKTPDPLCAAAMEEFFRLKAMEGNAGFAIAYALTLLARTNRKRSSPRSQSNVRPHAKIVVLSEEVSDEQHRRAFELEACAPGDDKGVIASDLVVAPFGYRYTQPSPNAPRALVPQRAGGGGGALDVQDLCRGRHLVLAREIARLVAGAGAGARTESPPPSR